VNHDHKVNLRLRGIVSLSEMSSQLQLLQQQQQQQQLKNRRTIMTNVFSKQSKSATMRLREAELRAHIEQARVRVDLLRCEKVRLEEDIVAVVNRKKSLVTQVEEKSSFLMRCFHGLAKEKSHFREWMAEFEQVGEIVNCCYSFVMME
jgi:predicted nuclease with TOPRIM domain